MIRLFILSALANDISYLQEFKIHMLMKIYASFGDNRLTINIIKLVYKITTHPSSN